MIGVALGIAYAVLLAVLIVRVRSPDAPPPAPVYATADDPLRLVSLHHGLFFAILVGAPLEALILGGGTSWRWLGLALFAVGVAGYRVAGAALGSSLSPLVAPRPGARLVTSGPYRFLRHPMYLSQALIAVGAPLSLGCRWTTWLALPAVVVLAVRCLREEVVLRRAYPEYDRYAARAKRLVPFVF